LEALLEVGEGFRRKEIYRDRRGGPPTKSHPGRGLGNVYRRGGDRARKNENGKAREWFKEGKKKGGSAHIRGSWRFFLIVRQACSKKIIEKGSTLRVVLLHRG